MKHQLKTCLLVLTMILIAPVTSIAKIESDDNVPVSILELPFEMTSEAINSIFDLGKIVVTPTRTAENVDSLGSAVSVFTDKEMDARGIDSVEEALSKDYSIDVGKSGYYSGASSVFIRGANAGHTRFMIDGVRMHDPISPNGAFDPSHFMIDNIRQIEVVKGPQSSLYGSDAIGGVVNVITERGHGTPSIEAYAETGSFSTYKAGVTLQGQLDRTHFALGGSYLTSEGISSARDLGDYEEDPYENTNYSGRIDYDLTDDLNIGYIGRYHYADYEFDDQFAPLDDDNINGWSRQYLSSVILKHQAFDDLFEQKVQLSMIGNDRRDFDENDPMHAVDYLRDWYYGSTEQASWVGSYRLFEKNTLVTGVDFLKEKGESYYYGLSSFGTSESVFPKRYSETMGYFGEYRFNLDEHLGLTLNYRVEDHSRFGSNETYKADALYRFEKSQTAIKGSYGTGFKAPTLYQLFAPADPFFFGGGNVSLMPEESKTYEIGIDQPFYDDRFSVGVTYFHNDFENLIDAVYNPSTFFTEAFTNVGKAMSEGIEVPFKYNYSKKLQMAGNYTWLTTENKDNGEDLLRRAGNKFNIDFNYIPFEKTNVNLDFSYVGHREDSGGYLLKSYYLANLNASYDVTPNHNVYVRFENVLDAEYEVIRDYGRPGFSVYGGTKVKF